MIKELTEKFQKRFTCLGECTKKCITSTVPIKKEGTRIDKIEKLEKIYLTYYNLLNAQDLWQAHYQVLSIIFLKEFTKLNVNMDMIIKNVEKAGSNIKIANAFLNIQTLKMIQ